MCNKHTSTEWLVRFCFNLQRIFKLPFKNIFMCNIFVNVWLIFFLPCCFLCFLILEKMQLAFLTFPSCLSIYLFEHQQFYNVTCCCFFCVLDCLFLSFQMNVYWIISFHCNLCRSTNKCNIYLLNIVVFISNI